MLVALYMAKKHYLKSKILSKSILKHTHSKNTVNTQLSSITCRINLINKKTVLVSTAFTAWGGGITYTFPLRATRRTDINTRALYSSEKSAVRKVTDCNPSKPRWEEMGLNHRTFLRPVYQTASGLWKAQGWLWSPPYLREALAPFRSQMSSIQRYFALSPELCFKAHFPCFPAESYFSSCCR